MLLGILKPQMKYSYNFFQKQFVDSLKYVLSIAVEMKSVMNKVSAGYVWRFYKHYMFDCTVLHVHNDVIII